MIREESDAVKAEAGPEMLDEPFAHQRRAHRATPFALQRGHRLRHAGDGGHMAKQIEGRMDIDEGPVPAHPIAHRNALRRQQTRSGPDAVLIGSDVGVDAEIGEQILDSAAELAQKSADVALKPIERQDRIERKLAGHMEDAAAAAIDPTDRPAAQVQFLWLGGYANGCRAVPR